MSLLDEAKKAFCMMDKISTSDGEGGLVTEWVEGAEFELIQQHNTTIEAQIAERNGTASTYTFLFDKNLTFRHDDYIKRLSDGAYFRITQPSGEDYTPPSAGLHLGLIKAEKTELPT